MEIFNAFFESFVNFPKGVLLSLIALLDTCWVFYIIFVRKNFKQKLYKAYFFYAIFVIFWVLSNAYFELPILRFFGESAAQFMAVFANLAAFFSVLGFYIAACFFKNHQKKISRFTWIFVILIGAVVLIINSIPNLTIQGVDIFADNSYQLIFGNVNIALFLLGTLVIILGFINFLLAIKEQKEDLENKKFLYIFSGMSLMYGSIILFHIVFLTIFRNNSLVWLPPALSVADVTLVGYAIFTQRFPSLKLFLSGISKAIFVLLCSLAVGYFFGILLFGGLPEFYSVLIFCVISALGYHTLIKYFDLPVFYYLLGASNLKKFKAEIGKFRNKNTVYTDLAELNKDLRQTFRQKFFIELAQIIILDRKTQKQYPAIRQHCQKDKSILVTKELELQENQQEINPLFLKQLVTLGEICLPLFSPEQKLIGFFVLGPKPFQKPYTKEEIEAVEATQCHFSTVLSSVLHSTKLQNQLEAKNKILQKQNAAMRKLLKQQSDFIDVAAHELRTPLTIAQGYAEMLKPSPEAKTMQFGLKRLTERVKEILYVNEHDGKKVGFNPSKVKVAEFFIEIYHNFVPTLEKEKRQFSFDNKINEEIEAEFDTSKICQVIENLLTNALNFTKENGIITFHLAVDQEKLKFAVTDNGCGVPDDTKEEIFKKFRGNHATKSKGLGLGLYLCKTIVKMHKGKIWCEDAPLKSGTTFYVEIPLKQELAKVTKSTDNEGITKFA